MQKTFCLLTPLGRGAVATTWVRGKSLASELAKRLMGPSSQPIQLELLRPTFGYWQNSQSGQEGLVACLLDENTVEIHSHGGMLAPQLIGDTLVEDGFERLTPEQLVADTCSDWIATLRQALVHAPTKKTAIRLLRLYQNSPQHLTNLQTQILADPSKAGEQIETALSFAAFGAHLRQPWKVVVCGHPNVGKSSLINALSGFERTIVHDSPGTTRDVISQVTAINGWPILLTDTAGVRDAADEIEQRGVERAIQEAKNADLRIALFDASNQWSEADARVLDQISPELIVHNKIDRKQNDPDRPQGILVSATERIGLDELMATIIQTLIPQEPPSEQWFPINERQSEILRQVSSLVRKNQLSEAASIIQKAMRIKADGEL